MSDPSAPSELEKRSTETTASTPLKFSVLRLALAFAIAGVSDVIGAFASLAPPIGWAVDVVTAALLFVMLGWQWLLLPGLVLEAIPGRGTSILAAGGWSNCCLRHASAENRTELRPRTRGPRFGASMGMDSRISISVRAFPPQVITHEVVTATARIVFVCQSPDVGVAS